jgi:hypothetical protein
MSLSLETPHASFPETDVATTIRRINGMNYIINIFQDRETFGWSAAAYWNRDRKPRAENVHLGAGAEAPTIEAALEKLLRVLEAPVPRYPFAGGGGTLRRPVTDEDLLA